MRRPISILFLIYILGIFLGSTGTKTGLFFVIIVGMLLMVLIPKNKSRILLILLFAFIGFWTSAASMNHTSDLDFLHRETSHIKAKIHQPPIRREHKTELILELQQVIANNKSYPIDERALGNIYLFEEQETFASVKEGDIISFTGKIRIPKGLRNPGGLDYSLYLRSKKIYTAITIHPETIVIEDNDLNPILKFIYGIKNRVESIIDVNLPDPHGKLLKGILFGQKELNDSIREDFADSGIAHILAVSGLHVGFVIGFISYLSKKLKWGKGFNILLLTLVLGLYIVMTGGAASVIRASMMAWIYLLSKIISKRYDGISALSLSGFIILLPNPLLLFSAGFQLSFLAALSIIIFYPILLEYLQRIRYMPSFITTLFAVTMAAQIGTIPCSLYHFKKISLISVFTNLLTIPILGTLFLISILGIILYSGIPFIGGYLLFLSRFLSEWIINTADFFSSLPMASVFLPPLSWAGIGIYISLFLALGGYIPLKIKKARSIYLVMVILLLIIEGSSLFLPQPLRVTFLDVNQGDSILIQTPGNKNLLIDGGGAPSYQDRPDNTAEDILIPALYAKNIKKLHFVMVSHPHDDHIKGIQGLIGNFPIDAIGIFDSGVEVMKDFIERAKMHNIQIVELKEGHHITIEKNLGIEIISPGDDFIVENEQKDLNNLSIVARLDYHKRSFLFTGDIEEEMEGDLVNQGKNIETDVLKVAHHGSATSSTKDFIEKANPKICIISVGENNNFGHPDPQVVKVLENKAVQLYRTDENGAIEIQTNGHWIKAKPFIP